MKHLDLFSGIGGFAMAANWCGFETVAFSEIDDFASSVLDKNFPNIPNLGDIKNVGRIQCDIITGGFPCQPFSVAGHQKAQEDDRHLWPEMFRVITQSQPTWVVCENVFGLIRLGLDQVLFDLESIGYSTESFVLPACSKGAPHRRDRVFIVAYSSSNRLNESKAGTWNDSTNDNCPKGEKEDFNNERCSGIRATMEWGAEETWGGGTESPSLRVDDGLPDRMDRIKSLGNAISPQVAYELMKIINQGPV